MTTLGTPVINYYSDDRTGPITEAVDCTGYDGLLVFLLWFRLATNNPTATVTYNGVSMTQEALADNDIVSSRHHVAAAFSLANPSSGSNNVSVTYSFAVKADAIIAIPIDGVDTANIVDAVQTAIGGGGSPTLTITTASADSRILAAVCFRGHDGDPFTPTSPTTIVSGTEGDTGGASTTTDVAYAVATRVPTTAGNYDIELSPSASDYWALVAIAVKEGGGAPASDVLNRGLSGIEQGVTASGAGGHSGLHSIDVGFYGEAPS